MEINWDNWKYQPMIYGTNEIYTDEYFENICENMWILEWNENKEKIELIFKSFLMDLLKLIKQNNQNDKKKLEDEVENFWKMCEKYISWLTWAYEYIYKGKITKNLAWKNEPDREKFRDIKLLRNRFPNLYLAMYEINFIENIFIDNKWNFLWYLKKEDWKYIWVDGKWQNL